AVVKGVMRKQGGRTGGEGRQPQREPGKLHRHRIQIDATQTTFGDRPPDGRALARSDVTRMAAPVFNETGFIGVAEVVAGGDEKRAAAHRRVEHAYRKY